MTVDLEAEPLVAVMVKLLFASTSSCEVWLEATVVLSLSPSEISISLTLTAISLWCLSLPIPAMDCLMPLRTDSIVPREEELSCVCKEDDELLRFRLTVCKWSAEIGRRLESSGRTVKSFLQTQHAQLKMCKMVVHGQRALQRVRETVSQAGQGYYISASYSTPRKPSTAAEIPSELPLKRQPAKFGVRPPIASLDATPQSLDRNGLGSKAIHAV